eukprot:SAG11_NODE_2705_length_3073_cov_2.609953_3_plen_125_part_00
MAITFRVCVRAYPDPMLLLGLGTEGFEGLTVLAVGAAAKEPGLNHRGEACASDFAAKDVLAVVPPHSAVRSSSADHHELADFTGRGIRCCICICAAIRNRGKCCHLMYSVAGAGSDQNLAQTGA